MQGKGLVKFFFVMMALVCLWYYALWIPTNNVERAADAHASKIAATADASVRDTVLKYQRSKYLDSMSLVEVFGLPLMSKYTYADLKKSQLALGLDLKGGMSVLMQVDLSDLIRSLSGNTKDPLVEKALANSNKRLESAQTNYITIFAEEWNKVAGGKTLASLFYNSPSLKDKIKFDSKDADVINVLRGLSDETVQQTYERLKLRIDELGVVQPNVALDKNRDLIMVELPGIDNPARAREMLTRGAALEFWDVYRNGDNGLGNAFQMADERLKNASRYNAGTLDSVTLAAIQNTVDTTKKDSMANLTGGPLLSKFNYIAAPGSAIMGTAAKNNIDLVTEYLNRPYVRSLFPRDAKFAWSQKAGQDETGKSTGLYELYLLKEGRQGAALDGSYVVDAASSPNDKGQVAVSLRMNGEGAQKWGQLTTRAANDGNRQVAIVLDGRVVSAPSVRVPILDGNSEISGSFTSQEGEDLASVLKVGKLPATPKIVQESVIGPSLGQENINKSLFSLIAAILAVVLFMVWYYSKGGVIAVIALFANLFFLIGSLMSLGTVLTLPGMAGIVLTLGMAVDANVIIYERIREELRLGKSPRQAMNEGFQNAMSAIIDGNVTTFLVALVLIFFGIGPLKGFGVVLAVGIITTLFTAVLLSRLVSEWWSDRGNEITFFSKTSERFATRFNVDWMGIRKKAYMFSGAIILLGVISMFTRGFDLGVEFRGGYNYTVQFDKAIDQSLLQSTLSDAFDKQSTIVKSVSTSNTYDITTSYLIGESSVEANEKVTARLFEGINKVAATTNTLEQFKNTDSKGTHITKSTKVGPTIADDIKRSSIWAAIMGMLSIFFYILLRFSRWQYSAGGVIALAHDVLITLSMFSILHGFLPFSLEVDSAFIAAILTIIGYSINDTVIVYDRIREYLREYSTKPMGEVINSAINTTMSRTIITSLTVFLVLLVLFIFGGSSIRGFSFALLVGVIAGTYSSIFIAAPIMMDLSKKLDLTETKVQTVVEKVAAKEEKELKEGKKPGKKV